MNETNKDKLKNKILQILAWQQNITNQGINYTGEKDWALNQILGLLATQEEKILHQFETIDIKMGDPDAEAKVKFAIKAMVRHIKLKNATK